MAEGFAVWERGAAVSEAAIAAAAAKAAARSAAAKALREARAMGAAQNACKTEEDWNLPVTPQQQRSSTARAAKARATDEITNGLALEDAPEHVALGARIRKEAPKSKKRAAPVTDTSLPVEDGAPAPTTPVQKSKKRWASVAAADPSEAMEVSVGNLVAADTEWADFRATPVPQHAPGENVRRVAARLLARKALSVLSAPPTVVQLERLDTLFKALGKMPRVT
ncbi:g6811 [Coccomyxa elongata]